MEKKKYLLINSTDRVEGSPSDFRVKLPYAIKFKKCQLIQFICANTFYNITNANNGIIINNVLIKITPGNYNLDEFFTQITTQIPEITAISFNDTIGNITFSGPANFQLSFPTTSSINKIIGFDQTYDQTTGSHVSLFGPSLFDVELFIIIDHLSSNMMTTNSTNFVSPSFIITNLANKNDIIFHLKNTSYENICSVQDTVLQHIYIQIKNKYGEIVQNLSEWSLLLSFFD